MPPAVEFAELISMFYPQPSPDSAPDSPAVDSSKIVDPNGLSTQQGKEFIQLQRSLQAIDSSAELIDFLVRNPNLARLFYSIDDGGSRFPLVTKYSFDRFWEALSITAKLQIHEAPLNKFKDLLSRIGYTPEQQAQIVTNLRQGKHPFFCADQPALEQELNIVLCSDDFLDGAILNAANVLGNSQLGVCMKMPLYRSYLSQIGDAEARAFLLDLGEAGTLSQKRHLLEEIETCYPKFESRIETELLIPWRKMSVGLWVALKVEDVLDFRLDETVVKELFASLSMRANTGESIASNFINMVFKSLNTEINKVERQLFNEVSSHLEGAFEEIKSVEAKQSELLGGGRSVVRLRYLDKSEDLVDCLRFADSKICCYSTPHYDMHVAHYVPNKVWKMAIIKDPLFFIFQLEELPPGITLAETAGRRHAGQKNLGFVFGSFGMDAEKNLAVILNGAYLASGNNEERVLEIMNAIEKMLSRPIGAKVQITGSKAGGTIGPRLGEYTLGNVKFTRLRALSDSSGKPQTKIYDDLGTVINTPSQDFAFTKVL